MSMAYTVRVHPRARHVRLRMDPRAGLIVTVPPRFDQRRIPLLLAERRDWIEAVGRRQARQRASCEPAVLGPLPQRVDLLAVERSWSIAYELRGPSARLRERQESLVIGLPEAPSPAQAPEVGDLLRRWLAARARAHLGQALDRLADQYGLAYQRLSIRYQRSRWGSCSARGNISLNARLMFCPPSAVRYVLIHELVHTEHLNHSPAFWARVAELMPDYAHAQRDLKAVWQGLPDWA
ncbi:MAG: M48 family metallopeptidase [Wenzhouxiangella sp.]